MTLLLEQAIDKLAHVSADRQDIIASLIFEALADEKRWLAEKDWEQWDRQIETDSMTGKLDFLLEEARAAKIQNKLRAL